jgi:hypothetical protein
VKPLRPGGDKSPTWPRRSILPNKKLHLAQENASEALPAGPNCWQVMLNPRVGRRSPETILVARYAIRGAGAPMISGRFKGEQGDTLTVSEWIVHP